MPVADPRFTGLDLDTEVAADLQGVLPRMAERTVAAIIAEVPAYTDPFRGRMGQNIENAVQASLGAFLRLATRGGDSASDPAVVAALDGAYELGRGEARDGRSIDALLAADMLERAKNAMVKPFVVSVMADPSGAYTTAAAMVACVEAALLLEDEPVLRTSIARGIRWARRSRSSSWPQLGGSKTFSFYSF